MKAKRYLTTFSVILMSIIILAGCNSDTKTSADSDSEKIKLKYAFFAPATTYPALQMQKWKEELEERTNGKVEVELYPGGTLLDSNVMFDGVKNGVTDIGLSVTSHEPERFPLLAISDIARYPNAMVSSRVVFELLKEYEEEIFEGGKVITAFTGEPSYIQSKEPVETIEDLKGMQLRISGTLKPVLTAMGAAPIGMSQAAAAEALQTGVIEGTVASRDVLKDFKFAEMIDYFTDYPLNVNTFVAVMTKEKWDSLPEDVQEVIDELALEMSEWTAEYHDNQIKEAVEWSIEEHGVIGLTPKNIGRWDEIFLSVQDDYVKEAGDKGFPAKEYKERMDELIEKYSEQ